MTEAPEEQFNRRASDHAGGRETGNVQGGRRKSDRRAVTPRSTFARFAIAGSFLFSLSLIAWAFTLPFRSGALSGRADVGPSSGESGNAEYEARMASVEYVSFAREKDQRLMEQLRQKTETLLPPRRDRFEVQETRDQQVESKRRELKVINKVGGGKGFAEGTIEDQQRQELESEIEGRPK